MLAGATRGRGRAARARPYVSKSLHIRICPRTVTSVAYQVLAVQYNCTGMAAHGANARGSKPSAPRHPLSRRQASEASSGDSAPKPAAYSQPARCEVLGAVLSGGRRRRHFAPDFVCMLLPARPSRRPAGPPAATATARERQRDLSLGLYSTKATRPTRARGVHAGCMYCLCGARAQVKRVKRR
jgi:hypothetical protein